MKLISTISEIQDYVPVQLTSDILVVKPYITVAERSFLVRSIGHSAYMALVAAYIFAGKNVSAIANEATQEAVRLAQATIANLGYHKGLPVLAVKIGNSGIQVFSNQDTKQAFNWQVDKVERSLLELGFNNLEALLEHMEQHPTVFAEYHASDEYRATKSCLIRTAQDFSANFNIKSSRFVFSCIAYIMRRIEAQDVEHLFGESFIDGLRSNVPTGKVKTLAEKYLKPGIALLTGAKAIRERVITLDNGVASINLAENYSHAERQVTPVASVLDATITQLTDDGNRFLADGLAYAVANMADMPGFEEPGAKKRYYVKNNKEKGIWVN